MILDPSKPAHARALERLASDRIAWLTTVTPDGQPQTLPVWFTWLPSQDPGSDGEILVYGDHRARRNRNLEANRQISLALRTDEHGSIVFVIEGEASLDPDYPPPGEHEAFLAKYGQRIDAAFDGPVAFGQTYSMAIRIRPTRLIAYA
jgi:PPOX class probable F420-dependent enzyme